MALVRVAAHWWRAGVLARLAPDPLPRLVRELHRPGEARRSLPLVPREAALRRLALTHRRRRRRGAAARPARRVRSPHRRRVRRLPPPVPPPPARAGPPARRG